MQVLARARDNLVATALCFVALVALTAASGFGLLVWALVALASGGTGWVLDLLLVGLLAGVTLGSALSVLSLAGVCYGLCTRVSAAFRRTGTRVAVRAEAVERRSFVARLLGVSDLVAAVDPRSPSTRAVDRVEYLKAEYVSGALSEAEFERRVRETLTVEGRDIDRAGPDDARHGTVGDRVSGIIGDRVSETVGDRVSGTIGDRIHETGSDGPGDARRPRGDARRQVSRE